jgi:carbonic anhydrase/acetyltransferase-like protein (isoleucine patch superfamily)
MLLHELDPANGELLECLDLRGFDLVWHLAGDHPFDPSGVGFARLQTGRNDRMLIEHDGRRPAVDPSAWVAPNAVLSGDVRVGPECRVLYGAVLTDEGGQVELSDHVIVMENALIRGRGGYPSRIGRHVIVGPHAHINGAEIADEAFIATGAALFPGARVGARAEVRINGVVHVNTTLAADGLVPIGWVAVGSPAEVLPPDEHERIWKVQRELDFPGTVFGLARDTPELMAKATERYAKLLGTHRSDRTLPAD